MDKTIAGLLGAVGALVAAAPGHAAPLQARSYSELLQPIPNALATLRAMDGAASDGGVEQVQLGPIVRDLARGGHHHHHHHRYYRRRHHHHHHHHHHDHR